MVQREQFYQKVMKGIYVLVLSLRDTVSAKIGALGSLRLEKGLYAYVGSAQNNLEKRVERHLKKVKKRFWHIDYLLDVPDVKVLKVFLRESGKSAECKTARQLAKAGTPIEGFGSSDCNCQGHLFKIKNYAFFREYMSETVVRST